MCWLRENKIHRAVSWAIVDKALTLMNHWHFTVSTAV
jgi:hypothetical protein